MVARTSLPCCGKPRGGAAPPIRHVFIIVLENKGFDTTFGPSSPAIYLSQTLTAQGQLLRQYYGIGAQEPPQLPGHGERAGSRTS